ncbi:DeoR family transcriptional regulator [Virgibacillus dakarensis]|uniref:DeoR family transcriptional regulator n=1 Tax=Lentibacillus populi TaxID=1827502 RepID=A0A9W5TY13_9BACI|nr:DeoR/GlpR family DNA-binding transcription regulator [Virgibacillus dakarensis]MTW88237.1 DeoR family transcriptional regulator [Virgibacillus dakarensis]GGB45637.1 DeoR family transcriptional regulator [Lentibacillus populi]
MFAKERHKEIVKIVRKDKSVKVSQLMKYFNVSFETIRRDLEFLEKEGLLTRVHGGAVLEEVNNRELSFTVRESKYLKEKQEIAKKATDFVVEGQSIAMDVSTTNTEFAKKLKEKFTRLTVLTNSMTIANELSEMPDYTIIFAGGILRNQELCTVGDFTEDFITQFHIDTFFMSISGLSLTKGLTDYGAGELQVKKKMMDIAQHRIVLADSSKFDVVSLLKVCEFNQINRIITDSKINENVLEKYRNTGIEVL